MSPSELFDAITTAQDTLSKVDGFLQGSFVTTVTKIVNTYTAQQLRPLFELVHSMEAGISADELQTAYGEFQADLNNARQIDLSAISNAGEWLKNHPLILRFVANHFTKGTVDEQAVQQMREAVPG